MSLPTIDDILGIEQTKLGYFQEWQKKIQELRDAHSESERRRQANAAILDGITDLMMVLDADLRIISVNKVFEELFPNENAIGRPCYSLFRGTDVPCPECPAVLSLRHGTVNREKGFFHINGNTVRLIVQDGATLSGSECTIINAATKADHPNVAFVIDGGGQTITC